MPISPKRVPANGLGNTKTANLYPFTYETRAHVIRAGVAELDEKLALNRRCLARSIHFDKTLRDTSAPSYAPVIAGHRRSIDRLETYRRNAMTRLREIGEAA